MNKYLSLIAMAFAMIAADPAFAHHSAAMFDHTKITEVSGTVKSLAYQAPHTWISLIGLPVGTTGNPVQWDVELGAPIALNRWNITKQTLKPGDKVTIGFYPMRDGRNAGSLLYLDDAEGKHHGVVRDDAFAALPK